MQSDRRHATAPPTPFPASPPKPHAKRGRPAAEPIFWLRAEKDGTTLILTLTGELDWAVIGHIEGALEQNRGRATERVVFDLRALTFIDIAGLRTILELAMSTGST